jgi:hypothetical protein
LIATCIFYQVKFTDLQARYTKLEWPILTISETNWWENGEGLARRRTSLFGFASQRINLQWAGNLPEIESTLIGAGWQKPPARDFISTLHRIADISSTQYLPMVSPQYLDDKPVLILSKQENNKTGALLVIRLWDGHRRFSHHDTTLWVGIIDRVPSSYSWLFKEYHGELEINSQYVFPTKPLAAHWDWKINAQLREHHGRMEVEKTMFIRPLNRGNL